MPHHDWIVHLDEETRFDLDTVEHIFAHCVKQEQVVARSEAQYPSIGQSVIYYNTATIDNYLTTLADYIRVSDDYAKFQLQYKMFRLPLVGMHGSFVVCQTSLERDVGWDWGMVGSITEDTYFAMYLAAMGVRIDWCGGKMYEQSPFSCSDFAKQRARWFSGLWLCVLNKTLPLWQRAFLGTHLVSRSLCPVFTLVTWINLLVLFPRSQAFIYLMSFVFAIPFFSYVLGFVLGASPAQFKHGIVEWCLLLVLHVSMIPVYTILETWGFARGIFDRSTFSGFHIVQKEKIGTVPVTDTASTPAAASAPEEVDQQVQNKVTSQPQQAPEPSIEISSRCNSIASELLISVREEHLAYWQQVLNIDFDQLDLIVDAAHSTSEKNLEEVAFSIIGAAPLEALAMSMGVDKQAVLVAITGNMLHRYVRSGDVMLGVVVGDCVEASPRDKQHSIVPVYVTVQEGQTFRQLTQTVSAAIRVGATKVSGISLDDLSHGINRPIVFHALNNVQDMNQSPPKPAILSADYFHVASMQIECEIRQDSLAVSFSYDIRTRCRGCKAT